MADVCGDNRFEIIAKVKERLIKATNIEMHPEELAQVDNILFRLWQLNYFNQCNSVICNGRENAINYRKAQIQIKELEKENAELESEVKTWKKASELNSYKAYELGERANQLLKDKGNLIDENNELKKQIEKMDKAKKLITELINCMCNLKPLDADFEYQHNLKIQAEQFLKEQT